ncbi:HAD-IB family hydrolase [Pseudomonas sp. Fl5BN2]|uniref:HAD-IB family hydrolase n=1 Tax=Pseudomonas sp. Fl5BN2 TaxID=2697652 RepID=UPI001376E35A|nr:HAD-IB family hydrolase [Pseudomonas sp. Fl5BN2]NBF03995.1 HAD-IB family hydrolase [Pseudomonas sp. Fl5BN2]
MSLHPHQPEVPAADTASPPLVEHGETQSLNPGSDALQVLSVFDFDGTLTRHDSFVPFLRFAFGQREFNRRMLRLALPSLGFLARRVDRDQLKAQLIATFLKGVEVTWVQQQAQAFCQQSWTRLMRPSGLQAVASEIQSGALVTLCSASPALVLQPFATRLGVRLIGTELEVIDGVLSGRILGHNCRCENKVLRLESVYGPLSQYRLRAWGDTRGDRELLAAAQDPHWRHFHPAWRRSKPSGSRP